MKKLLLLVFLAFSLNTYAQVSAPKKVIQAPPANSKLPSKSQPQKKTKQISLQDQLMMHWKPLKGDAILNALAKVSVGKWVPAPRGIYPLQFINEEIEKFEKQHGKISSKLQIKELEKKLQPHLAKISELPSKQVEKWLKTCRYEPIAEDFLPPEVKNSETYQKLNLKDAYLFEDEMAAFLNVLALRDGKVWLRTYASLEERATQTEAKKLKKADEVKTFTAAVPLVDFSYVLRKSFASKKCLGTIGSK